MSSLEGSGPGASGTHINRRHLLAAFATLAGALVVSGCSADSNSATATPTATTGPVTPPEKPAKIVMRAWGEPYSTSLAATAGASFTAKTGIPVEFDLTDFPEMKAKIEQAIEANQRPFVDVAYTTAPDAYVASSRGYAVSLDTENLVTNYSKLTNVGKPDDGTTNWVNIYSYSIPIVYRSDLVSFPDGASIDVLWDPKYKGKGSINLDPNALVWSMSKMMGLDPAKDDLAPLWKRVAELRPNMGAIYSSDTEMLTLMKSGEIAFAVALSGDVAFVDPGKIFVPSEGAGLSADGLYVPKGLPDNVTYWAQVLVNEVISTENQTAFTKAIAAIPTNSEAEPPKEFKGNPGFPFTDEELTKYAIPVINKVYAEHRDEWIGAMTSALQG